MSHQSAPVTFLLDNTFLNMLATPIKPGIKFGDVFNEALKLPNIRAALIPNHIYAWELQGKVFDPDRDTHHPTYRQLHQPMGLAKRQKLEAAARWVRAYSHLEPEHSGLQRMMNDPSIMPRKLMIVGSEYDRSIGENVRSHLENSVGLEQAEPQDLYNALNKSGLFKSGLGEQRIAELIEHTQFHSHVYVRQRNIFGNLIIPLISDAAERHEKFMSGFCAMR